ncbi:MAG TPA: carboxyl transferase domain-containing protein [Streptosporangiaceae bacterium]|nr:carboxyl transferase domain-containing protein [Streptosporangiaceae bacterium]
MPADAGHQVPTGSRPLYADVADDGSAGRFGDDIEPGNPNHWPGYPDQLTAARDANRSRHAVTTGHATVEGEPCILIGFEFGFLGGSAGVAEGARITRAFEVAMAQRVPVVCVAASGGARIQEGTSALVQMQAFATAVAAARRAGIPYIAVATDPTTGGVWSSLIACADVLIGISGARVSFSGSRTRPRGADPDSGEFLADAKWAHGFVDVLTPVAWLRAQIAAAIRLLSPRSRGMLKRAPLPRWPPEAGSAEAAPDAWAQVKLARGDRRARAGQWLADYFAEALELRGDRGGGVDAGLRCGFGRHLGATIAYIAQTGAPTTAAGFRTATRLLGLAARFSLPVLTLIDTPGAAAQPADEAAGVGTAIAELLVAIAASPVYVTSVVIGEGVSGGAVALAAPADLWIAQSGYLAVTAPELATSILKLGPADTPAVAERLGLTPADLMASGLVRGIISPPRNGAARSGG